MKHKRTILVVLALGIVLYVFLCLILPLQQKNVLSAMPLDLSNKDRSYSINYSHPFYGEDYAVYLQLKKQPNISFDRYDAKKINWAVDVKLTNKDRKIVDTVINKMSFFTVGYGSDDVEYGLIQYRHSFFAPRRYTLEIRLQDPTDGLRSLDPRIIVSFPPRCGLEAVAWVYKTVVLLGLAAILLLEAFRKSGRTGVRPILKS